MSLKPVTTDVTVCDAKNCGEPIASNKQWVKLESPWELSIHKANGPTKVTIIPAGDYHRPCLRKIVDGATVDLRGEDPKGDD